MRLHLRRYLRFSIRALLALTLLCSLPLAWMAMQRSAWRDEQAALQAMEPHVSHVEHAYVGPDWLYRIGFRPPFMYRVWLLDFAGYSNAIWHQGDPRHQLDDELLAEYAPHLLALKSLEELHLEWTHITDNSAAVIQRLDHLRFLNIQDDDFSDSTVRKMQTAMPNTKIFFFFDHR